MLKQEFSCAFQDVCRIDSLTRRWLKDFQQSIYKNFYSPRFCQKCRLKKCLKVIFLCLESFGQIQLIFDQVGMKREWELSEGEKKGRSSREAKRSSPPSTPSLSSSSASSSSPPNPPPPIKIDTCRKRPQATVQPSWREASENKVENENRPNEQKRCFFFSLFFQCQCFPVWPRWLRWRSELSTRYQVWERWSGGKGNFKCWRYFVSIL